MPNHLIHQSKPSYWPALGNSNDEASGQKVGRRILQKVLRERLMAAGGSRQQYAVIFDNHSSVRTYGCENLLTGRKSS
jgi:hypothetical protein